MLALLQVALALGSLPGHLPAHGTTREDLLTRRPCEWHSAQQMSLHGRRFSAVQSHERVHHATALLIPLLGSDHPGYIAARYPQRASPESRSDHTILRQDLDALNGYAEEFGGAMSVHRVSWLAGLDSLPHFGAPLVALRALFAGHLGPCCLADGGIGPGAPARDLGMAFFAGAGAEQAFARDAEHCAAVTDTAPESAAVLIFSREVSDQQPTESAARRAA